ncbi:MAG: hypothetical protein LH606_03840 [Cytophagaceae bacterium]|nr:hypothetical protein [Cytophagaceae bacterium]
MKNLFLITALLLVSTLSFAQGYTPPDPVGMAGKQTQWLKKTLTLDASQETKVTDLNLKYAKKTAELRASAGDDRAGMREKMQTLNLDKEKELQPLLNEEQWKTYEAKKANMREEMGYGRRPGGQ